MTNLAAFFLVLSSAFVSAEVPVPQAQEPADLERVASRAYGEAHNLNAFGDVVCTIKNRTDHAGSLDRALRAYFAPDKKPPQRYLEVAEDVWNGDCDPRMWYALSRQDLSRFNPGTELIRHHEFDGLELFIFSRR